jgi:hypothetical protein
VGLSFVRSIGARERLLELTVGHAVDGAKVNNWRLAIDGHVVRKHGAPPPEGLVYKRH